MKKNDSSQLKNARKGKTKKKTISHRCSRGRPSRSSARRAMECLRQDRCTPGTAWGDRRWEPGSWWSPGSCDRLRGCGGHTNQSCRRLFFYFRDVAGAAGRRTRPVRVARLDDSTWLGSFMLVGGNFGKVRERGRRRGCLHVDHGRKRREGIGVRKCVPTTHHPPIDHPTITAVQQQYNSSATAVEQHVPTNP